MKELLLTMLVGSSSASSALEAELSRIVAGNDVLPSLSAVQSAAEKALRLMDAEAQNSWSTRARTANLLPTLDASAGTDADVDIRDYVSHTVSRTTTEGQGFVFRVGARWKLSGLVFEPAEFRASRELLARSFATAAAKDRATKAYFDRVRVLLKLRKRRTPELILRAAELDGILDAMTGGVYSVGARRR